MKARLCNIVFCVGLGLLLPTVAYTSRSASTVQHAGTWRLISVLEEEGGQTGTWVQSNRSTFGSHPAGYLMYDGAGHVCAQLINTDRSKWTDNAVPTPEEARVALNGFGGYCGRYELHESEGYVIHIPEVDVVPNEVGQRIRRDFTLRGNQLVLQMIERRATDGRLTKKVIVWERIK